MNLEPLKEKLGEDSFNSLQKYVTDLIEAKETARKESIEGRKNLKAEVADLRALKNKFYDKLGLADDADIDELVLPTKDASVEQQKQFERQIKKLTTDLQAAQDNYKALEGKHRTSLLDATLQKALAGHEFVDAELVAEFAKGRIRFTDEGELNYVDGDKALSVEEGIKLIASSKPHLLKAQGAGGSGFNPNANAGKVPDFKSMSLDEKMALAKTNKAQYDQMKAASAA